MTPQELMLMKAWAAIAVVGLLAVLIGARQLLVYVQERRMRQLEDLRAYSARLRTVVAEMLAKANDLDQARAYLTQDLNRDLTLRIGGACEELVSLGESLPLVDQLLERKNLRAGREHLLLSCRMAEKISKELSAIDAVETRAITDRSQSGGKSDRSG